MCTKGFTFLELTIVLAVLATLISLMIPFLSVSVDEANDTIQAKEMADIQRAFLRFHGDCVPTDAQLQEIRDYGLWPLCRRQHPDGGSNYPAYDNDKQLGWRGAYAATEGTRKINKDGVGQPAGTKEVPVILDPYGDYYRVLMPNAGADRIRRLAVVATGRNKILQTTDVPVDGFIKAGGDDVVLRLLPLAP